VTSSCCVCGCCGCCFCCCSASICLCCASICCCACCCCCCAACCCCSISAPARLLATPAPKAAAAHLPLIIFKRGLEINILSESGRPYQLSIDQYLRIFSPPKRDIRMTYPSIGKLDRAATYQIIRLVLEFFLISPEEGYSQVLQDSFSGPSRAEFKSKYPQYRIVRL
jgi:hypothetical protein